ncbi:TraB/GumN family protein [Sphingobium aromaticiconvertens]|uniref:TraB/GumN family protein n=1 Tax=Sphingobium aromaticiconvertens TaxID=365341 RepID=UPI0030171E8A
MKAPFSRWLAAALLLLGTYAPGHPVAAKTPKAAAAPALWVVKDADTTIYLFGTVHVLKPGIPWFSGDIKRAFDQSDELVLEIVEPENPNEMAAAMAGKAMASDGVKLSDRLSMDARGKYQAAMVVNGLPWAAFEGFYPWMSGMMLSVAPLERLGYKADLGAEKQLTQAAKATGKPVSALETVEQQISYFASLPMEHQIAFLNATVNGLPDMEREFASLIDHWRKGESDKLADEMNDSLEATPELAKVLLVDRNANWAAWIKQRLDKPGAVFIAVGAGHLAGRTSVQAQLKGLGVASKRVRD